MPDRRRCTRVFLEEFEDSCEGLTELGGGSRVQRQAIAKASADAFFEQWAKRTATTDHELASGRWKYKGIKGDAARKIGLRQIYLHGGRGLLRAAVMVVENDQECTMTFILAYHKRDQDNAIVRACAIVA